MLIWIVVALIGYWLYQQLVVRIKKYPPGPFPLPGLGNTLKFDMDFTKLGKQMAELGDAFSGRPSQYLFELTNKGKFGLIAADGPMWREQRRFALHVLRDFGFGRLLMEEKVVSDLDRLVQYYQLKIEADKEKVAILDPKLSVTAAVSSIISNLTFSSRFEIEGDVELKAMLDRNVDIMKLFANPLCMLLNLFPVLRFIPLFGHFKKDDVEAAAEEIWNDMRRKLDVVKEHYKNHPDEEAENYATAYLKIQQRVHEEIKREIGLDRQITMNDRQKTPLLSALIHELQRFCDIIPLNLHHRTTKDVVIDGKLIPEDTWVVPHVSAVMRNPKFFPKPDKFNPDRFLDESGESLAKMELYLIIGSLLQKFKFDLVDGDVGKEFAVLCKPFATFTQQPPDFEIKITKRF